MTRAVRRLWRDDDPRLRRKRRSCSQNDCFRNVLQRRRRRHSSDFSSKLLFVEKGTVNNSTVSASLSLFGWRLPRLPDFVPMSHYSSFRVPSVRTNPKVTTESWLDNFCSVFDAAKLLLFCNSRCSHQCWSSVKSARRLRRFAEMLAMRCF